MVYLSSRAIGQSHYTKKYLQSIAQDSKVLPDGPLLLSPTSILVAFRRLVFCVTWLRSIYFTYIIFTKILFNLNVWNNFLIFLLCFFLYFYTAFCIFYFYREVIDRKPEEFKIAALTDLKKCFPLKEPFYAGFGNRETVCLHSYFEKRSISAIQI